jgi:hypothetical protein
VPLFEGDARQHQCRADGDVMAAPAADRIWGPIKRIAIVTLCLCLLAVPCLYDVTSTEPSPLAALFVTADAESSSAF